MNLEAINKWLDEEYGCSYTKLEELYDFYFEKYCDLKKENKILKENAEHNDKVVDKVNWENMLLKKNKQLKDNWNKLKEYLHNQIPTDKTVLTKHIKIFELLDKMQEIEQGSDSNENNNI